MNILERIKLLFHIIRWRLTWSKKDLDCRPSGAVSSKFITAREAASLIPDGAVCLSNGLAGNARCSVFFWAIRARFEQTGHPRDLTWVNVGAQGSRGKVPGTLEELGLPGLLRRYIAGHLETCKAQLRLADAGQLELYTLPQGVMSLLLEAQSRGERTLRSPVGIGAFIDPRVGNGGKLTPHAGGSYVSVAGDQLEYTLPALDFTFFNAPYADAEGNIYFHNASTITENLPSAAAVRANGGKVCVTVSAIIPKDEARIGLHAEQVDHIVLHPYNEQTASIRQRRYWPMFAAGGQVDFRQAARQIRFINNFLKITPVRTEVDFALARLAADVFERVMPERPMVNIGVGFPEEVARELVERGHYPRILFTTEAGAYGGLPCAGIFFSAAINPHHLESSSDMFRRYASGELDIAVLGFLQVDKKGNVNASKRGPRHLDYVGPGGFPDIADGAHTVLFVGAWMAHAAFSVRNGRLHIERPGIPKFVEQVDEITFNGAEALKRGKRVFYITNIGAFQLTETGLKLIAVMPGVEVERDIKPVFNFE